MFIKLYTILSSKEFITLVQKSNKNFGLSFATIFVSKLSGTNLKSYAKLGKIDNSESIFQIQNEKITITPGIIYFFILINQSFRVTFVVQAPNSPYFFAIRSNVS